MTWGRLAALAVGGVALLWVLASAGLGAVANDVVLAAGYAVPGAIAVHAVQLALSGYAWRVSLGETGPGALAVLRIRWIREGVNTLLPVAQIGGPVVGARMLVQGGVTPALSVASTILDLTLEAGSQLVVVLAAVGMLLLRDGDRVWVGWVEGGLGLMAVGVAGVIAGQRLGLLRLVETMVERASARWPGTGTWSMAGLHATLMQRQADRGALVGALLLHCLSWSLGTLEVWLILRALGQGVGLGPAFVIESLAMAARSAGFAVPGAVGVQEGGFILVCGLFGLGAETALAVSVLKRVRELIVGFAALLVWRFTRRTLRSGPA